jgi:hypothetical protein
MKFPFTPFSGHSGHPGSGFDDTDTQKGHPNTLMVWFAVMFSLSLPSVTPRLCSKHGKHIFKDVFLLNYRYALKLEIFSVSEALLMI